MSTRHFKALNDIDGGRIKTGEIVPTATIGAGSVDTLVAVGAIEEVESPASEPKAAPVAEVVSESEPVKVEAVKPEPAKPAAKSAPAKKK